MILFLIFGRNGKYTITFDTNGGNEITSIDVKNNQIVKLPEAPKKDGYKFVAWINENGKVIIILSINPTKAGYFFAGWGDKGGNTITNDTIVNDNMTIKAIWKEPYTCPADCKTIGDGSKCTKTTIKDVVTYTGCPSGTETVEKFCSAHKRQVAIGFDEDLTYETAGIICNGNPAGFCADYNGRYTVNGDSCPSGYYKYTDSDGLGALCGCAKKYSKGGSSCPSGYTQSGNVCTKTETINCKEN